MTYTREDYSDDMDNIFKNVAKAHELYLELLKALRKDGDDHLRSDELQNTVSKRTFMELQSEVGDLQERSYYLLDE